MNEHLIQPDPRPINLSATTTKGAQLDNVSSTANLSSLRTSPTDPTDPTDPTKPLGATAVR
jgi:hypothetical protein